MQSGGEDIGYQRLGPGQTFGDFSEVKGKNHNNQCVLVMSDTLKCIQIRVKDMITLYQKTLTPENLDLIRGQIPNSLISQATLKKVAIGFSEKRYPSGKFLIEQDKPLKYLYLIKSGTCEVFNKEHPLKHESMRAETKFFQTMPFTGEEVCLGLSQGSMSKAFNYFPIKMVGRGSWIGTETFFNK